MPEPYLQDEKQTMEFSDIALEWFCGYLSGRRQKVCMNSGEVWKVLESSNKVGNMSNEAFHKGQCSALRHAFSVYSTPTVDICGRHKLAYHLWAEDTQLYTCLPNMAVLGWMR